MQATTQGTNQAVPAPATRAELQALVQRRDELNDQVRSLTERTGRLMQERMNASATNSNEVVRDLTAQIAELSARTRRLEGEKLRADDAISEALARGLGTTDEAGGVSTIVIPPPFRTDVPPFNSDREEIAAMFAGGLLGVTLLSMFLWRMATRRAERKFGKARVASGEAEGVKELRHAVEAIAVEVERISEGQRFVTALLSEKAKPGLAEGVSREDAR